MTPLPPLDTSGTRYSVSKFGQESWVFGEWGAFLKECGLCDLDSFMQLSGEMVDRNRRSVVHRIELGPEKKVFYLKLHCNYYRQNLRTLYRKIPVLYTELVNLMDYGRAGIDVLEPVAWGHQFTEAGGTGFILLEELDGFCALRQWLLTPHPYDELKKMTAGCATMVRKMHRSGLAHIDLFSWHIFVKDDGGDYEVVPIDLERTKKRGKWPFFHAVIWLKQLHDLAVLTLTTAWPQVSDSLRMRFYLIWLDAEKMNRFQKIQARLIMMLARHLGRKRTKFKMYGVAERLQ